MAPKKNLPSSRAASGQPHQAGSAGVPSMAALHELPGAVADVALVSVRTCAAIGEMSDAWWLERVRNGEAPAPVIRQTRFTRWRLSEVRAFWIALADAGKADANSGKQMAATAKKASDVAHAKRRAAVQLVPPAAL